MDGWDIVAGRIRHGGAGRRRARLGSSMGRAAHPAGDDRLVMNRFVTYTPLRCPRGTLGRVDEGEEAQAPVVTTQPCPCRPTTIGSQSSSRLHDVDSVESVR